MVLLALLIGAMAFVLWYVIDRRAKMHALRPVAEHTAGQSPAGQQAATGPVPTEPVDLTKHDLQTIDFSSGKPVVKDSPEDKAAIDAAVKDMAEATKDVTFEVPKKKPEPPPAPPKN